MSDDAPWDLADEDTADGDTTDRDTADAYMQTTPRRLGLGGTVGLLLTALALLLMLEATTVLNRTLGTSDDDRLADLAYAATREVADAVATPLAREDRAGLRGLVTRLARGVGIAYVLVLDPEGEIVAHSFEGPLPPVLVGANDAPGGQGAQRVNLPLPDPVLRSDRPVLDVAMPIVAGQLGVVRVGMDAGFGHAKRREVLLRMLAFMGATSLGMIVFGMLLSRRFSSPAPSSVEASLALPAAATDADRTQPWIEQTPTEPRIATDPEPVVAAPDEPDAGPIAEHVIVADEAPDSDDRRQETEARTELAEVVALAERIERDGGLPPTDDDHARPALAALSRALTAVSARAEADCRATTEAERQAGTVKQAETEKQVTAEDEKQLVALESQLRHCARTARAIGRGKWTRHTSVADEVINVHPHIATIERAHEAMVRRVATLVRDLRQHATDLRDGTERLTGIHGGLQHDLEVQATDTDLAAAKLSNVALGLAGVAKDHNAAAGEGRDVLERAQAGRDLLGQMLHRLSTHRQAIAALAPRLNGVVHGTTLLSGHAEALANVAAQVHLLALDAAGRLADHPDPTGELSALAQRLRVLVVDSTAAADALSVQADQIAREAAGGAQSCDAQDTALAQEWEALRALGDNLQTLASVASSLSKRVAHAAEATNDMPDLDAMTHDVQTIRKAVSRLQDAAKEGTRVVEALRQVAESVHKGIEPIAVEE